MPDKPSKNEPSSPKRGEQMPAEELDLWDLDADDAPESSESGTAKENSPKLPRADVPKKPRANVRRIGADSQPEVLPFGVDPDASAAAKKTRKKHVDDIKPLSIKSSDKDRPNRGRKQRIKANVIGGQSSDSTDKPFVANRMIEEAGSDDEKSKIAPLPTDSGQTSADLSKETPQPTKTRGLPTAKSRKEPSPEQQPNLSNLDSIDDDFDDELGELGDDFSAPPGQSEGTNPPRQRLETLPEAGSASSATSESAEIDHIDDSDRETPLPPKEQSEAASPSTPISGRDLLLTSVVILTVLIIAAIGVSKSFESLGATPSPVEMPDFPIAGSVITLANIETYWRPPDFTSDAPDRADRDSIYLPVIRLTVADDSSPGLLRLFFIEQGEDEDSATIFHGDTRTITVQPGQTYTIYGSEGFTEHGDLHEYQLGDRPQWFVNLREASANDTSNDFQPLVEIPILTDIYDQKRS